MLRNDLCVVIESKISQNMSKDRKDFWGSQCPRLYNYCQFAVCVNDSGAAINSLIEGVTQSGIQRSPSKTGLNYSWQKIPFAQ